MLVFVNHKLLVHLKNKQFLIRVMLNDLSVGGGLYFVFYIFSLSTNCWKDRVCNVFKVSRA
jgi:hypothetical protein